MNGEENKFLQLTLEETVNFAQGEAIAELSSVSLEPNVQTYILDDYVNIRGTLELVGDYFPKKDTPSDETSFYDISNWAQVTHFEERSCSEFRYTFPVDVTIPLSYATPDQEITMGVAALDHEILANGNLHIRAKMSVSGILDTEITDSKQIDEVKNQAEESGAFRNEFETMNTNSKDSTEKKPEYPLDENIKEFSNISQEQMPEEQITQYETVDFLKQEATVRSLQKGYADYLREEENKNWAAPNIGEIPLGEGNAWLTSNEAGNPEVILGEVKEHFGNMTTTDHLKSTNNSEVAPWDRPEFQENILKYKKEFPKTASVEKIEAEPVRQKEDDLSNYDFIFDDLDDEDKSRVNDFYNNLDIAIANELPENKVTFPFPVEEELALAENEIHIEVKRQPDFDEVKSKMSRNEIEETGYFVPSQATSLLDDLFSERDSQKTTVKLYIVQKGDSLNSLADRYSVNVNKLARYNKLQPTAEIEFGQIIYIPK